MQVRKCLTGRLKDDLVWRKHPDPKYSPSRLSSKVIEYKGKCERTTLRQMLIENLIEAIKE